METYWLLLNAESVASSGSGSVVGDLDAGGDELLAQPVEQSREQNRASINAKDRRLVEWNVSVLMQRIKAVVAQRDAVKSDDVVIPDQIASLLEHYVAGIASMYRDNAFHNFEHASHVTMSVTKMLSRIVGGDLDGGGKDSSCYTKDITSEPLSQLTAVLSA